jgi:hypothetical protein
MRLIINGGDDPRKPDPILLKAVARARGWFEELASGRVRSLVEIARREGLAKRYVTRLTKLAFVSPDLVDAIAEGVVPTGTNLQMLMDGRLDPRFAGTIRNSFSISSVGTESQPSSRRDARLGRRHAFRSFFPEASEISHRLVPGFTSLRHKSSAGRKFQPYESRPPTGAGFC